MKKAEIIEENAIVTDEYSEFMEDCENGVQFIGKLRSCNAEVLASSRYYILKSYRTIVAVIDANGNCYDFLRLVYGYTATSASHISKFCHDYHAVKKYTWREV